MSIRDYLPCQSDIFLIDLDTLMNSKGTMSHIFISIAKPQTQHMIPLHENVAVSLQMMVTISTFRFSIAFLL